MSSGFFFRTVILIVVILTAWAAGNLHGQAQAEDNFFITIEAPGGRTALTCEKGCSWKTASFHCPYEVCYQWINQDGGSAQKRR